MIIQHAIDVSENHGYVEEGETVVITGGSATSKATTSNRGLTNMIRVQIV
jgi:pyruvate kinase